MSKYINCDYCINCSSKIKEFNEIQLVETVSNFRTIEKRYICLKCLEEYSKEQANIDVKLERFEVNKFKVRWSSCGGCGETIRHDFMVEEPKTLNWFCKKCFMNNNIEIIEERNE